MPALHLAGRTAGHDADRARQRPPRRTHATYAARAQLQTAVPPCLGRRRARQHGPSPIAIAIGMNAALQRRCRPACCLRAAPDRPGRCGSRPQCVLAVSGAATHVPDTSFQTLIYDLFIYSLNKGQAPLAVRFEKSCTHASRKKNWPTHCRGSTQSFSRAANLTGGSIFKNQEIRKYVGIIFIRTREIAIVRIKPA